MGSDSTDDFHVRIGRSRSRGGRRDAGPPSFVKQVEAAIRRAGGNPNRIGGSSGKGSGRFNARGRGAKVLATFPKDGGGWQRDSAGRFRSRRVVVKARVVKLNPQRGSRGPKRRGAASKAADAHLRYLERDGVTREGEKGRAYSSIENDADGRAFIERGREDRHQFRFIVAPEDAVEMDDLRGFTRDLMRQMEKDLDTRLDWVAVDHHNTGHPHTHIIIRGVTDDRKILNIAGDYIAHGVRHRASELVTLELGHQSELEVAQKLRNDVDAERLTRLDKMLIAEQREHGTVDLRPSAGDDYLIRENRHLLISRAQRLERFGLATQIDPGRWLIDSGAEGRLRELGERGDIIKTMHRALADHGLAEKRGVSQYANHGGQLTERVVGRVIGKGLAGDEMAERVYLVVDGVDGRVHHMEFADPARIDDVRRGMIVEVGTLAKGPSAADRNIQFIAGESGIYRPSEHLEQSAAEIRKIGGDPDAFVRSHVRRLEALRRARHVERIDADHWQVPGDLVERGAAYDASRGGPGLAVRTLSTLDLERQISSDGATWLDRELVARTPTPIREDGFGRDVIDALDRRSERLVEMGHATIHRDGTIAIPRDIVATLERSAVERVGEEMAKARGRTFQQANVGEYVSGTLVGSTMIGSSRFAMLDDGLGFSLVPWQPVLEKRIDRYINGTMRGDGGIEWSFQRQRGLER